MWDALLTYYSARALCGGIPICTHRFPYGVTMEMALQPRGELRVGKN